jgi:hypothetical protein
MTSRQKTAVRCKPGGFFYACEGPDPHPLESDTHMRLLRYETPVKCLEPFSFRIGADLCKAMTVFKQVLMEVVSRSI